ncbi:MAG: GNAT family N-acetyltransferase [Clostridiaceae bacterium]|nr:GNAT family N-acetyltransferase [Clostridiaceae bacterium]
MIKKGGNHDILKLTDYLNCEGNLNTTILANLEKYGLEKDFQNVWFHIENNNICAVIMRYFNHLYLYSMDCKCDMEELVSFISFTGSDIISGKRELLKEIAPYFKEMKLEHSNLMVHEGTYETEYSDEAEKARLDDCHEMACLIYGIPEFARFYNSLQEIERGIRRRMELGLSRFYVRRAEGVIVSQAYTTVESNNYATIGGVVTRPEYRNKGMASSVVLAITRDILKNNKSPNLLYSNPHAGRLYEKLGFKKVCDFSMLISNEYLSA